MASGFAILFILVGGFIMASSFGFVLQCSNTSLNAPNSCWDPRYGFAFAFYVGAIFAISGAVVFFGPTVARQLEKLRGGGPDSKR